MDSLETKRLLLRKLNRGDVEDLAEVLEDDEAMLYYPRPKTRAETAGWIDWNLRLYEEHGFGLFGVVLRGTGELIGDMLLFAQRLR